jgi:Integrase core domain
VDLRLRLSNSHEYGPIGLQAQLFDTDAPGKRLDHVRSSSYRWLPSSSPWQNGIGERWIGSCRRDLLDHVMVLNEPHLKRLLAEYVRYYNDVSYCPTSLCA